MLVIEGEGGGTDGGRGIGPHTVKIYSREQSNNVFEGSKEVDGEQTEPTIVSHNEMEK